MRKENLILPFDWLRRANRGNTCHIKQYVKPHLFDFNAFDALCPHILKDF